MPESRSAAVISATMYGWEIVCPSPMGRGFVRVREVSNLLRDEEVTRHLFHHRKHALVANSPTADLFLHHAAAEDGFLHQVHFRKARRAA